MTQASPSFTDRFYQGSSTRRPPTASAVAEAFARTLRAPSRRPVRDRAGRARAARNRMSTHRSA